MLAAVDMTAHADKRIDQLSGGQRKRVSWAVTTRAAVDALSAIADVNRLDTPLPLPLEPEHAHTPAVLLTAWGAIAIQALAFAVIAWFWLHRRRR